MTSAISSRVHPARFAAFAAAALGFLPLAACDQDEQSAFAPACPHVEILGEAADSYDYNGRGLDVGSLVSHASMTGLTGACEAGPTDNHKKIVRTRLSVAMNVARGPAAKGDTVTLPYFVAVLHDGHIVDKKVFETPIQFEPNVSTTTVRTPVRIIDVPASDNIQETNYAMEIGFQLTHAQLDYNRTHLTPAAFSAHSEQ